MSMTSSVLAPLGVQEPRLRSAPPAVVSSAGQEAIDLAAQAGLVLDPWQRDALTDALAERPDGKWAGFEVGLVVSRQNGKGSILEARELAGLYLFREEFIVHSAHEFKTAAEAFRRILSLVENTPHLDARVQRVTRSNGEEGIELKPRPTAITGADGRQVTKGVASRLRFFARTGGSGRGFSGDTVILDEAYNLPEMAISALMPIMATKSNPQLWYTSSAVDQKNPSHQNGLVLARIRRRGLKGDDPSLVYLEWSAPDDAAEDDQEAWAAANPGLGIRISHEHVARELRSMDRQGFRVERLSIGDWPADPSDGHGVIPADDWVACLDGSARFADGAQVGMAVDVTPDRKLAHVAGAGMGVGGRPHLQVLKAVAAQRAADEVLELWRKRPCTVAVDPGSPAGALIPDLEAAGVEVLPLTLQQIGQACGGLYDAVVEQRVTHLGQGVLDAAVKAAQTRVVSRDAWAWDCDTPGAVSPLYAVTYALHAFTLKGARDPVLNVW